MIKNIKFDIDRLGKVGGEKVAKFIYNELSPYDGPNCGGDYFQTEKDKKTMHEIIINGKSHLQDEHRLSFEMIVELAFFRQFQESDKQLSMTYKFWHGKSGILTYNKSIQCEDCLSITVCDTSKA